MACHGKLLVIITSLSKINGITPTTQWSSDYDPEYNMPAGYLLKVLILYTRTVYGLQFYLYIINPTMREGGHVHLTILVYMQRLKK